MSEDDDWFARLKRRRRWLALHEDRPVFGLVPTEVAELEILDAEFGQPKEGEEP